MFIIRRNIIFPLLAILSFMATISSFLFSELSYTVSFLTFLYLVFVPGFLVISIFRLRDLSIWDVVLYAVGLSLFILMVPGVLFNYVWPLFSSSPPLQTGLLATFFGVINIVLVVVASFRCPDMEWHLSLDWRSYARKWYFIVPPIFTVLSVFAANVLNNGGSNILAIATMSSIGLCILLTIIFRDKLHDDFFPTSIYFHSLSLLLILSLRSNYVSGWDIQSEFVLFQLTKYLGIWRPENMRDAYNACLSISLLPTIFVRLTSFADDYVYKLLYQIIFAITPVAIYQIYRKYTSNIIGFIAVIYIISQPLFILPMTALMRQEIAFIFFALMFWVLFTGQMSTVIRSIIFLIFGIGMIISHYSTTYVTLLLLLGSYPLISIYRLTEKVEFLSNIYTKIKLKEKNITYSYFLNPIIVLALIWFTLIWYGLINNQLGQVQRVATEGLSRMNELFRSDVTSGESKKALPFAKEDQITADTIRDYVKTQLIAVGGDSKRLYPKETYKNIDVHPIGPAMVSPIIYSQVNYYILVIFEALKQLFKLCVMLSPLYLLVMYFRKDEIPRDYMVICTASVFVIVVMTFHPYFGLQYNLSRFYLQLLFFLSLPAILLAFFLFFPLKKWTTVFVGVLIFTQYIYLSGLMYQLFGGEARMYLNNFGADYDKFYMHEQEVASGQWLKKYIGKKGTLFMDREANLRLFRIINRGFNYNTLPALIYQDAYVYASYANIVSNRTRIHTTGAIIEFTFPRQFLEENKDVVYSNGKSKIYR